ncbi:unnamed protein product [Strongylus vulgaris]|uniref:Alpha-1,3-glucosyltransferase n=1 Tax=Strongylus vulgaris TaxID=40348 RepID=A0A3P7I792_STRVU|nr:unnamed protein product [Strongylus vulgaris]
MELYHALPIFVFILARSSKRPLLSNIVESFTSILRVAAVVVLSFIVLWFPFIVNGTQSVLAVLSRIFPFYRGLYEASYCTSVFSNLDYLLHLLVLFLVLPLNRQTFVCGKYYS